MQESKQHVPDCWFFNKQMEFIDNIYSVDK
jgi:hypothetical protein